MTIISQFILLAPPQQPVNDDHQAQQQQTLATQQQMQQQQMQQMQPGYPHGYYQPPKDNEPAWMAYPMASILQSCLPGIDSLDTLLRWRVRSYVS